MDAHKLPYAHLEYAIDSPWSPHQTIILWPGADSASTRTLGPSSTPLRPCTLALLTLEHTRHCIHELSFASLHSAKT